RGYIPAFITTNPFRTLVQKMSDQKNYEDDMSLPDRPEVRQQRRGVTAGVATLGGISARFALLMQRYSVHYSWAVAIATFLTMLSIGRGHGLCRRDDRAAAGG